jgi:hypothetical protein
MGLGSLRGWKAWWDRNRLAHGQVERCCPFLRSPEQERTDGNYYPKQYGLYATVHADPTQVVAAT